MNAVKGTSDKMESHVLLEECLQDHTWVNAVSSLSLHIILKCIIFNFLHHVLMIINIFLI